MSSVSQIIGVRQREYGITNSKGVRCIGTPFVSSCVAMIVYNRMCKEAVLAHMDHTTATDENIKKVFALIADRPGALKVTFVGGWIGSGRTVLETFIPQLIKNLKKNYGYAADQRNLFRYKAFEGGYSYVGIDTETGEVTALAQPAECPAFTTDLEMRSITFGIEKQPLEFAADGREPIAFNELLGLEKSTLDYYTKES